ncbi:protein phosphatase CheZ [endosymbiont of unidentified scaly snail isolate Monju]|uniref:protein phosphatase CheZ n=1 Tax=endosymbiont of unidentified scaly snail isolate Monju TaxID=1248727 RepID=UPI00038928EE|nr:protein phosphatase CheZ [endosymbiont of unidentified scaly snail isolate Monju]BAN69598.1 chemotaxis protein CheZ [endosymbiont of unidentified scaly snail isolate Monju]
MGDPAIIKDEKLELARLLVARLEEGREEEALNVIAQLAGFRDSLLFQEVGRLTCELHDAIKGFMMDARLAEIAESEMPDAAERLRHVISLTEEAANTTLNAVEQAMPLAETLRTDSRRLAEFWERFKARQMNVEDFRAMSRELEVFLRDTQKNSEALHAKLSEVLMAQGYQDLTGQIIRKVIDLVSDVEGKLVELVRLSGAHGIKARPEKETAGPDIEAAGPVVPGVDKSDAVSGQDEVDDLLSSLGF